MLSKKIIKSINGQINKELYSAYLYLGMASYSASIGLNGFSDWFSEKMYNYVAQQSGRVTLSGITEPPQDFSSPANLFERTLEHERKVTGFINELVAIARGEKDNATEIFLQWFVTEQVEEEKNTKAVAQKIKMAGNAGQGLLLVNQELAARVFAPPVGFSFTGTAP